MKTSRVAYSNGKTKKSISKMFIWNSLNTTNCIALWKVGTVACQERIQISQYFPQCLIFTIQKKFSHLGYGVQAVWMRVCPRRLSPCWCFSGKPAQGAAAWPPLRALWPGMQGWEGDVVVAVAAPMCGAGQGQAPVDRVPGASAPGMVDAQAAALAGSHRSGHAAGARAGGFALWMKSSDLQVPHVPGCLLVCLVLA